MVSPPRRRNRPHDKVFRPDRLMPLRLHNYGGRALYDYTQTQGAIPGYLPTLIPLLVYQGPGDWPGPYLLSELSQLPGEPAPPVYMDLSMIVHDLHEDSLSSSALTVLAKVTFRLMRLAAREELVVANAALIAGWLDEVHETYGYDDYWTLMEYVAAAGEESGMIEAIVEHTDERVRPAATSTLEKLQAKAREEVLQGFRAVVERQLELRFGRLPARLRTKVGSATKRQLERWAPRVITAGTLAEVFEP